MRNHTGKLLNPESLATDHGFICYSFTLSRGGDEHIGYIPEELKIDTRNGTFLKYRSLTAVSADHC